MKRKIRNLKLPALFLAGILAASGAFAADVRMWVEPELISLLDRSVLKLEFTDTEGNEAEIPEVDGLQIQYIGPQTQYSFINGESSSSITHSYVITPTKIGDYTIGPVTVKYKGGEKTLTAKLRVIKPADDPEAQELSEMLFSEIKSERQAPYVNDPFQLSVDVYVKDGIDILDRFGIRGGLPETGLSGELKWQVTGPRREERDGSIYQVYTLRTTAKALTDGIITFRPEVQVYVVVPRQQRRSWGFDDPFFGDFFGRQETRPMILECNKLDIEVQPIPMAGRPASYTGGVGVLDFDVEVGPGQVKAGEPVTVTMRITGEGNLEKIIPPSVDADPSIKLYEANQVQDDTPNEIMFEQVVIPTSDSVQEIPPISFSYFNTKTSDFRTIRKGPFPISVEAAPQQAAQVLASTLGSDLKETEVLGRDIAYLKPKPAKWHTVQETAMHPSMTFRLIYGVPAAVIALTGMAMRRRKRLAENVALARRQKAPKAARKRLQEAEQAIRSNNPEAFHEAMWNGLAEYFGHRLNLAPGQITVQAVLSRIPEESASIESLFHTIEQQRYGLRETATDTKKEMQQQYRTLVATLKKCERMKL